MQGIIRQVKNIYFTLKIIGKENYVVGGMRNVRWEI